jgi:hypothetical protein
VIKPLPWAAYDPKSSSVRTPISPQSIDGIRALGLRLEPVKADTSVLIIDHIDCSVTD